MTRRPFLFLNLEPGRAMEIVRLVQEMEGHGLPSVFSSGTPGDNVALALALLDRTESIVVGTGITGISMRHAPTMATSAALIEELHPGRFILGPGVTHVPFLEEIGVTHGRPLADMCGYVRSMDDVFGQGPRPPVLLAALRRKMTARAGEIADGVIWANAALSHLPVSMAALPGSPEQGFILSTSAPVCVHPDREAALWAIWRYLVFYLKLEHYQNYFLEAGYGDEVATARQAISEGDEHGVMMAVSERLAHDVAVFGPAGDVRKRVEEWYTAGISHLILDPVSASSTDALVATREVMDAFDRSVRS